MQRFILAARGIDGEVHERWSKAGSFPGSHAARMIFRPWIGPECSFLVRSYILSRHLFMHLIVSYRVVHLLDDVAMVRGTEEVLGGWWWVGWVGGVRERDLNVEDWMEGLGRRGWRGWRWVDFDLVVLGSYYSKAPSCLR